jgi:multidrug efflux system membrane fusion protein
MPNHRAVGLALAVAALGAAIWALGTGWETGQAASPAPAPRPGIPVLVGTAEARDMPAFVRGLGTVQAFRTVAVKTRVDGQIVQVRFEEGQAVNAGDPLFEIDPRPFQAVLDQALGTKQRDEAQLRAARVDLDRFSQLVGKGFQTRQSYDNQKALVEQLQGTVKSDQATIEAAQLNLRYAEIRAPIDGRTGARLVDLGNLVQASQGTTLVTITQVTPIFVSFTVPQDNLDTLRRNHAQAPLAVIAYGADDETRLAEGTLTLIDNQIDTTTGTIRLKATFANADERLWPGEFVNARLVLSVRRDAVTVPAPTVMQGPQGSYVYVVKADDTVERRTVAVTAVQDGLAVIGEGLAAGERVVTDGQYRLTAGARVRIETPGAPKAGAS